MLVGLYIVGFPPGKPKDGKMRTRDIGSSSRGGRWDKVDGGNRGGKTATNGQNTSNIGSSAITSQQLMKLLPLPSK